MSIHRKIRAPIWPTIYKTNIHLISQRNGLDEKDEVRAGINLVVILNTTCFVEGALESGMKGILRQKREAFSKVDIPELETRKTVNILFNNLEKDMEMRIGRTTGIQNYDSMFELLINSKISQYDNVKPLWEGMMVLFNFRNVLAHGREVSATLVNAWNYDEEWKEFFSGGYSKAEKYLQKNELISGKFTESKLDNLYFEDKIADHFWNLSLDFLRKISESLKGEEKVAFDEEVLNEIGE